jgi:DNA ligase D-like protein (predicted 3'-phosphoesterase)
MRAQRTGAHKRTGGSARAGRAAARGARAVRVHVRVRASGTDLRERVRERARELGVLGWVRATWADEPGGAGRPEETGDRREADGLEVHAEGPAAGVESLIALLREIALSAGGTEPAIEAARVEGHEQFAIRGQVAGVFVVQEHSATTHHFDLRLEVEGVMRSWAVPKGPSMDPAMKRLAVQVEDHELARGDFEGATERGGVVVWDRGAYEQGGRVPWPEALERGHAVFVLHGQKLRGGFALQRTREGAKPQWLLLKRRDEHASPGSDVVAEQPASVLSGRTLEQLLSA